MKCILAAILILGLYSCSERCANEDYQPIETHYLLEYQVYQMETFPGRDTLIFTLGESDNPDTVLDTLTYFGTGKKNDFTTEFEPNGECRGPKHKNEYIEVNYAEVSGENTPYIKVRAEVEGFDGRSSTYILIDGYVYKISEGDKHTETINGHEYKDILKLFIQGDSSNENYVLFSYAEGIVKVNHHDKVLMKVR